SPTAELRFSDAVRVGVDRIESSFDLLPRLPDDYRFCKAQTVSVHTCGSTSPQCDPAGRGSAAWQSPARLLASTKVVRRRPATPWLSAFASLPPSSPTPPAPPWVGPRPLCLPGDHPFCWRRACPSRLGRSPICCR